MSVPQRLHPTDVALPVLLTGVLLTGLGESYGSTSYLVVGLVGAVVATLLAALAWSRRSSTGVYVLLATLAYVPVGAVAALRSAEYLGFPSPGALVEVLTGTITGPTRLLTTIPPVDPAGPVMVVPFALGYVVAAVSTRLATATRRPVAPVVPILAGLVAVALLGVQEPAGLLTRSAVFAGLAVWWCAQRAGRHAGVARAHRGAWLRAGLTAGLIGLTCLVLPVALRPAPAEPGSERTVLRGRVGDGHEVAELDNPLESFRRFTRQPPGTSGNVHDEQLLHVSGLPAGVPLRFVALDLYDGTRWYADNRTVPGTAEALFQRIGTEVGAPGVVGDAITVQVQVKKAYLSSWLPLAGHLTSIEFDYLDGRAQREDVRYNPATSTAVVVGGLAVKDDYTFTALLGPTRLRASMRPFHQVSPQPAGAFLDTYLEPWLVADMTPMERVLSLADYLRRNGRFSDGAEEWERRFLPGHSRTRLGPEFFGAHQIVGDEEQYAAFLALAATRMGVPARVAVGGTPGPEGWLHGRDVTAWVEVRIADGSWRMLPADDFVGRKPPRRDSPPREDPGEFVDAQEGDADAAPTRAPETPAPRRDGPPDATEEPSSPLWWRVPLAVLGLVLVPGTKALRRRGRRRARPSTSIAGGWQEVLDLLRDLGEPVPAHLARPSQAAAAGERLTHGGELARAADDAAFAPDPPTPEDVAAYWRLVAAERGALVRGAGALGRVRALWHPASLLSEGAPRRALRTVLRAARRALSQGAPPARPPRAAAPDPAP